LENWLGIDSLSIVANHRHLVIDWLQGPQLAKIHWQIVV
jgi:hypothetical protein